MRKIFNLLFIFTLSIIVTGCNLNNNHTHDYKKHIIDATCTTDGYTEFSCSCGDKYVENKVNALGHSYSEWNIVNNPTETQNGLKEKYCLKCGEKITEEIIALNKKSVIVFGNLKNSDYEESYEFDASIGLKLENLPEPICDGYNFKGWYTNSDGGEKVEYILSNEPQTYYLSAKWELISYSINYIDAPINNNKTEYTIEDSFSLMSAKWEGDGIIFSHWIDDNGDEVTKIDKGTKGDLNLTACWIYKENYIVSTNSTESLTTLYDSEGQIFFLYQLGTIQNVILNIADEYSKATMVGQTLTSSETFSVEKGLADTISTSILNIVSSSQDWSLSKEKANSFSEKVTEKISIELGVSNNIIGYSAKTSSSLELGVTDTSSWAETTTNGGTTTCEKEVEETFQSTVSYNYTTSKTFEKSYTIPNDAPNGLYSYVAMADVYVFMIITYDLNEGCYYLNTYSVVSDKIKESVVYSPTDLNLHIEYSKPLSYDFDFESFENTINNSYYVEYDANGGSGIMNDSIFILDKDQKLPKNVFTKEGYIFNGWSTSVENDVVYSNEQIINNIASAKETVKLYANWVPKPIEITLDASGGQLENNSITLIYGNNYGTLPIPKCTGFKFEGWYYNNNLIQSDMKLLSSDNHTLTAKWTKCEYKIAFDPNGGSGEMNPKQYGYTNSILIPENLYVKEGHTFIGWSLEPNGDVVYQNQQEIILPDGDSFIVKLYAKWEVNTYYIYALNIDLSNLNGDLIELLYKLPFKYGSKITVPQAPYKDGYVFYDWDQEIPTYMPANDIHIYATYLKLDLSIINRLSTEYTITDSGRENQPYDEIALSDLEKYKELGYTKLNITINLDVCEESDGYQHIFLYNILYWNPVFKDLFILKDVNENECSWKLDHSGDDIDTNYKTYTLTSNLKLDISTIISGEEAKDSLYVVYGASGDDSDSWKNKNLQITISFEK